CCKLTSAATEALCFKYSSSSRASDKEAPPTIIKALMIDGTSNRSIFSRSENVNGTAEMLPLVGKTVYR
ncbi:MAG: hypothetical protein C0508_26340, partial [Cyanobacteria bacterium PR.023]|nr:hypothetical protein [Cyanobacteria bacterium PR.023]